MSTLLLVLYHHHNLSLSLIGHISTSQPIHDGGEDKDVSTCQMMSQSASIYMCLWICLFVPWSNSFCISLCLRFLCLAVCISILLYLSKLLSQCPHAFSHALCVQVSNISINLSFACLLHDSCNSLSLSSSFSGMQVIFSRCCARFTMKRHLRCFELPQTVSLFSCLCVSLYLFDSFPI